MELQLSLEEKLLEQKAEFPEEMNSLLDRVPEIVEPSRSKEADKVNEMIDAILNFEVKQRGGLSTITIWRPAHKLRAPLHPNRTKLLAQKLHSFF